MVLVSVMERTILREHLMTTTPALTPNARRQPRRGTAVFTLAVGHLLLATAVPGWVASLAAADDMPWRSLTVRVYDTAAPSDLERRARAVAGGLFERARLHVDWRVCAGPSAQREARVCSAPPHKGDVIVRLLHASPPAAAATKGALGYTLIDPMARSGVLVTVYRDRVRHLALATHGNEAVLLGRVLAHEMAHAILARNTHRADGLMRPVWTFDEVRRNREQDWTFADASVHDLTWAHVVSVAR